MKKILSLILCFVMLMSMTLPALAAEETVSLFDGAMPLPEAEEILPEEELSAPEVTPEVAETPAPTDAPEATPAPTAEPAPEPIEETPAATEVPVETEEDEEPALDGATSGTITGTNITWSIEDGVLTISGTGAMPDYTPGGAPWYSSYKEITALVIGDGITDIGTNCFYGCIALDHVQFPEAGLTYIGRRAFHNCTALASIDLPETVVTIDNYAFMACAALTEFRAPAGLTDIGNYAFMNCTALASVTLSDSLVSIGTGAFQGCTGLTCITLPASVTSIGSNAVPSTVTDVYYQGSSVRWEQITGRSYITATVHTVAPALPASGTIDGTSILWSIDEDGLFTLAGIGEMPDFPSFYYTPWADYRDLITAVTTAGDVANLGHFAFKGCPNLAKVTLGDTLRLVGNSAFSGCTALETVDLGSIRSLGSYAFSDCSSLESITLPPRIGMGGNIFENCVSLKTAVLDCDFTTLPENTFKGCAALTSVTLPDSLVAVGSYAFKDCSSLKSIELPTSVTIIETGAFMNCTSLSGLSLHEGIANIGNSAFHGCSSLTSITIPETVTNLKQQAFSQCTGLKTVVIQAALTEIPASCFYSCKSLTSITIPATVTIIGAEAFSHCTALESIELHEGITAIQSLAFEDCTLLSDVTLPTTLTTLGERAFQECKALTAITIPGSVEVVGNGAFMNCTSLKTATLEEGVTTVEHRVFLYCSALKTILLPSTIESLYYNFVNIATGNSALTTITVADSPDGYEFDFWVDDEGYVFTTEDILAGAEYETKLTAYWRLIWDEPFTDVSESDWFYEYVKYCYQYELMNGISDTLFDPYSGATRAEVVTVLYRMAGEPMGFGSAFFQDVPTGQWYTNAVDWAADMGITTGYEDGTFRPDQLVTRQEFIVFLHRFADKQLGIVKNTWYGDYTFQEDVILDTEDIDSWALEAELWSVLMGLQTGTAAGNDQYYLYPQDSIIRAELATFLCRFSASIGYIAFEETMQDILGESPSYVTNALGSYNSYESFDVADPDYPEITEITYYYYDDFWVLIFTETDGTRYAAAWGYYEE